MTWRLLKVYRPTLQSGDRAISSLAHTDEIFNESSINWKKEKKNEKKTSH